jgi:thiamine monophosphate kinase
VEIQAATDNSDGLLGAIWNLAERSVCRMVLDLDAADLSQAVRDAAESTNIEPLRLGLMWGDWNVVACVRPDAYDILAAACRRARIEHRRIGRVVSGKPAIMRLVQGDYRPTRILRNEAFADWDYRTAPDAAVKRILHEPLDVADAPPT